MRGAVFRAAACLVVVAGLIPAAIAQAPQGYPGCSASPETCTAAGVNQGRVATGDEPVTVVLYAHFEEAISNAPTNTQAPDPAHERDLRQGFLMPTLQTWTGAPADVHFENNDFDWFLSPGLVEYTAEGWRYHHEQHHGPPVPILEVTGYAYFSAGPEPSTPTDDPVSVGVVPAIGVHMQVHGGRQAGEDTVYAEGDTGPGWYSPTPGAAQSATTMLSIPGQDTVYEFEVPMALLADSMDADSWVAVHPYQVRNDGVAEFTSQDWRIRTGSEFPHRLHVTTTSPIRTDAFAFSYFDGKLWARWSVMTAFGQYDVDAADARLRFEGPVGTNGAPTVFDAAPTFVRYPYSHSGNDPVNLTWRIEPEALDLPDGEYRVTATVPTLQGAYRLEWNGTVTLRDGVAEVAGAPLAQAGEGLPGPGLVLVISALAGIVVAVATRIGRAEHW